MSLLVVYQQTYDRYMQMLRSSTRMLKPSTAPDCGALMDGFPDLPKGLPLVRKGGKLMPQILGIRILSKSARHHL
jgi:hypothetical protein